MAINDVPISIDPATDIDWERDFVWVQPSGWLKVVPGAVAMPGYRIVKSHDGAAYEISEADLAADYMEVTANELWKPRYRPTKAHYLKVAARLTGSVDETVPEGTAILQLRDARFEVVDPEAYLLGYQVVGFPGTAYPVMPFQPGQTAA